MRNIFGQIILLLLGGILGVIANMLPNTGRRIMLGVLAFLLVMVGAMWAGYELGYRQATAELVGAQQATREPATTVTSPGNTASLPSQTTSVASNPTNAPTQPAEPTAVIPTNTPAQPAEPPSPTDNPQDTVPGTTIAILKEDPGTYYKNSGEEGILTTSEKDNSLIYQFDYNLPNGQDAYSGFVFISPTTEDLSAYEYINITVTFDDEETRCQVFLRNDTGDPQNIRLDAPPANAIIQGTGKTKTIRMPLQDFNKINLSAVKQIGFHTHTSFTRGKHQFIIESISFTKKK